MAEHDGNIMGMALYYEKYSTWKGRCLFLEDIIITEKYRGRGLGKLLFNAVAGVAEAGGMARLEWQVLDWNEPAISFYKTLGTQFEHEWINCKLDQKQLGKYKNG